MLELGPHALVFVRLGALCSDLFVTGARRISVRAVLLLLLLTGLGGRVDVVLGQWFTGNEAVRVDRLAGLWLLVVCPFLGTRLHRISPPISARRTMKLTGSSSCGMFLGVSSFGTFLEVDPDSSVPECEPDVTSLAADSTFEVPSLEVEPVVVLVSPRGVDSALVASDLTADSALALMMLSGSQCFPVD